MEVGRGIKRGDKMTSIKLGCWLYFEGMLAMRRECYGDLDGR